MAAVVDSGATASLIPCALAPLLGFRVGELDHVGQATTVGGSIEEYRSPVPVLAQVLQSAANGSQMPWGPEFGVDAFGDGDEILLGQRDFFVHFAVAFHAGEPLPMFTLSR